MDANTQKTLLREIKKFQHKGQGKAGAAFHEIPPTDFFPDISDVNEREMMFFNQCKEELKLSRKYLKLSLFNCLDLSLSHVSTFPVSVVFKICSK